MQRQRDRHAAVGDRATAPVVDPRQRRHGCVDDARAARRTRSDARAHDDRADDGTAGPAHDARPDGTAGPADHRRPGTRRQSVRRLRHARRDSSSLGNQQDTPLPVGSLMKLLAAQTAYAAGDPVKVVTAPAGLIVDPAESRIGIVEGQELSRDLLVRAMLIVSANDAARMLAIDIAGGEAQFADLMNQQAADLGLANTHAVNVTGLDQDGEYSSAADLTRLGAFLMGNQTFQLTVKRTERLAQRQDAAVDQRPAREVPRRRRHQDRAHHQRRLVHRRVGARATADGSSSPCSERRPRPPATPAPPPSSTGRSSSPDRSHIGCRPWPSPIAERPAMPRVRRRHRRTGGRCRGRGRRSAWQRSRNLWVVTVSATGRPHALPVWGVWHDDAPGFAWSCAPSARKAANIDANPQVCVMADDTVECVSVEGRARRLTDAVEIDAWIERYLDKYAARTSPPTSSRQNAIVRGRARAGVRDHRAGRRVRRPGRPAGASSSAPNTRMGAV